MVPVSPMLKPPLDLERIDHNSCVPTPYPLIVQLRAERVSQSRSTGPAA